MNVYKHVFTLIYADTYTHIIVRKRKKEKHEGTHGRKAELAPKSKMDAGCTSSGRTENPSRGYEKIKFSSPAKWPMSFYGIFWE